jgi:phenylalanine-4-hydroxylase
MAYRRGGLYGINKAIESENTATAVYSSGLQVTGKFSEAIEQNGLVVYFRTTGPTNLCYGNHQLDGHSKTRHTDGFGSPVGFLENKSSPLELFSDSELSEMGIIRGKEIVLTFNSGVTVKGTLRSILRNGDKILLLTFTDCLVKYQDRVLFEPSWGVYDMAVGEKIRSVFSGPADPDAFEFSFNPPEEKTHKIQHSEKAIKLHEFYGQVRMARENGGNTGSLESIFEKVRKEYPEEWLLPLEIIEIAGSANGLHQKIKDYLTRKKFDNPELETLINNGFLLIN